MQQHQQQPNIDEIFQHECNNFSLKALEDFHDHTDANCISLLEHEIFYYEAMSKKTTDSQLKEFYDDKIESLKLDKSTLEFKIGTNTVTPSSYLQGMLAYREALTKLQSAVDISSEHHARIRKRLEILEEEI